VRELVCLDMACGPAFVERLGRAWDEGDAVFPLDTRLPDAARRRLLEAAAPTVIADETGDTSVRGRPVEEGDAVLVATSGTTGEPRIAVLTGDAVRASALATSARLGVGDGDTWLACLPPSHVGGLSVITRALVTGTPLIAVPRFTPEACTDAVRAGATLVSLVATALARIDASLFRAIVLGGSPPPDHLPDNVVTTYGMTETGSGVVYDGVALEGIEVDLRDGVVHLRGAMLLRGWRDGTEALDSDGWLRTGDLGAWRDGRLVVEGREGDLIVTGGEKVWPSVVEDALADMEGVADVCVAGVPDPEWGHAVHAWIVAVPGHEPRVADVREHVKKSLPAWCAPRLVHLVEEIPRTALGKPRRGELVRGLPR
jgi:O-succinylbenzoic acid--CoA ligase